MKSETRHTGMSFAGYPFLAILFPILVLVSEHHSALYWKEVLLACAGVLGVVAAGWAILWVPLRDADKRGLVLFIFTVGFWTVAPLLDWFRETSGMQEMFSQMVVGLVAICALCIAVTAAVLLRRSSRSFATVTRVLNVLTTCTITVSLMTTAYGMFRTTSYNPKIAATEASTQGREDAPDIVIIVADMYGRHDTLEKYYDFDNTGFIEALEARDFYVAKNSYANYNVTSRALPVLMNYEYIETLTGAQSSQPSDAALMQNNRVSRKMQQYGYETIAYATGIEFTEMRDADLYLAPESNLSEFAGMLINRTPARFIANRLRSQKRETHGNQYYLFDIHRERILYAFDELKHLTPGDTPKFVFAHIQLPHDPFVLDAQLNPIYPDLSYILNPKKANHDIDVDAYIKGYGDHVQAFNTLALEAIDAILASNPNTVIVVLGDHGPRLNNTIADDDRDWGSHLVEEMGILNAYHLPGVDHAEVFYPSISPVNTFRVIFNEIFGEDHELLDDRSYLQEWWESDGDIHEVTDQLPKAF